MKCCFELRSIWIWIDELLYFISMLIIIFCLHFSQKRKVYQMLQSVCIWWESSIYQSLIRLVYLVQVSTQYRNERLGSINRGMFPKIRSVMQVYLKECNESLKKPVQVCTCTCNPFLKWSSSMDTCLLLVSHFRTRVYYHEKH